MIENNLKYLKEELKKNDIKNKYLIEIKENDDFISISDNSDNSFRLYYLLDISDYSEYLILDNYENDYQYLKILIDYFSFENEEKEIKEIKYHSKLIYNHIEFLDNYFNN